MRLLLRGWVCGLVLAWPLTGTPNPPRPAAAAEAAWASPEEVRLLMQAGRLAEAGQAIALHLKAADPDPEFLLLQCVVLANQGLTAKAITCLTGLLKLEPQMLEAYNNLGVLHASLGQHEEAARWFNAGMQRVPTVWAIHQNMQSLQLEVSRKAYASALQTGVPLKLAPPKLNLLATTSLGSEKNRSANDRLPVSARAGVPATRPWPAGHAGASQDSAAVAPPSAQPPSSAKALDAPVATGGPDELTRQQVQAAVEAWAGAWSAQNVPRYLAAYTADYAPKPGASRAAWEAERTARIAGRRFVRVTVRNFSFEQLGPKVVVRFSQVYESDNLVSTQRKRLDWVRQAEGWKIEHESVIGR